MRAPVPRSQVAAITAAVVAGAAVAGGALAGASDAGPGRAAQAAAAPAKTVRLKDARLKFEINSTDRDGGVQVFIDAESWKEMTILDPAGTPIFRSTTSGRMGKLGGTELFLESSEPTFMRLPLPRLLKRFPAGTYAFRGVGLRGERYVGSARLTHRIPDGPVLVSPLAGGPRRIRTPPPSPGRRSPRRRGAGSSPTRCSSCRRSRGRGRCPRSPST